jgi:hypothetical protein
MRRRNSFLYARVYSTDYTERLRRDPILSLCHKTERYNFYHGHGVRLVVALRTIHAAE